LPCDVRIHFLRGSAQQLRQIEDDLNSGEFTHIEPRGGKAPADTQIDKVCVVFAQIAQSTLFGAEQIAAGTWSVQGTQSRASVTARLLPLGASANRLAIRVL